MRNVSQKRAAILVFTLPTLILFTVIVSIPICNTLYRSFFNWDGLSKPIFNSIANYKQLFGDNLFRISLKNGVIYSTVLAVYQIGISSLLAVLLSLKKIKGRKIFRTSLFIPVVLSVTVVCQLWISIYNGQYGLLNKIFEVLGTQYRQDWLSGKNSAIIAIAFANSWQYMGYYLVLIYAAMQSIPEHYYEAAEIDGAGTLTKYFKITLPLLTENYKLCLTLTITGGLKAFSTMYIMSAGGPVTATYTLTYLMYRSAFRVNEFGYACASASVLVIQCLLATIIINKLMSKDVIYY
ncbi:sugar ABC transporter permease [Clostridium bowmanii]|uniref:carbohydrate ABC transporter permease n=1 Tax=Clostridium bowmanii TaxID=132925 RepID=UPI001C0D4293|nr:sugar ABC transporter permease [Clostridium bowmanii]MBU3190167.1 sugar ABC transporter permease [Clostridium bowmanii]MCA1074857.1 sugar ABC transporter permease [Clostridium bowmanii]